VTPRLGIVVLNWNGAAHTVACLESLAHESLLEAASVVVVDNGSTDGSDRRISSWIDQQAGVRAQLLLSDANLGYGAGNNLGIKLLLDAGADWIWILNNDTRLLPGGGSAVLDALPTSSADVLGVRLRTLDGREVLGAGRILPTGSRTRPLATTAGPNVRIDYIHGASMLVRREVFETCGLLVEDHFLFWEEAEFCARAMSNGFQLGVLDQVTVEHVEGATSGAGGWRRGTTTSHFYAARGMVLFLRRRSRRKLLPAVAMRVGLAGLVAIRRRDASTARAVLRGLRSGLGADLAEIPTVGTR
jgi:GT2 family glycosyltransferase